MKTILLSLFLVSSRMLSAQVGSLDLSFDYDGKVTTDLGVMTSGDVKAAVVQPDNKIVVVAHRFGPSNGFLVLRYLEDGMLDPSFSVDGMVTSNFGSSQNGDPSSLALQPNGKIVAAGNWINNANDTKIALQRVNANGGFDITFSGDGKLTFSAGYFDDYASAVAIQDDGKIVLAGGSFNGLINRDNIILVRFKANGTIDSSMAGTGVARIAIGDNYILSHALAIQSDGKFLIAGTSWGGSNNRSVLVIRCNPDGSVDSSFNQTGYNIFHFSSGYNLASSLHIQPSDGKILISGSNSLQGFALARLNPDGTFDPTFGTDGKKIIVIGTHGDASAAVTTQADGKILLAGRSGSGDAQDFTLMRLHPDGALDNSFGTNGYVTTDFDNTTNECMSIAVQGDGKVVLVGKTQENAKFYINLARYLTESNVPVKNVEILHPQVLAYPNPVSNKFTLKYTVLEKTELAIHLYDVQGRFIETLLGREVKLAGEYHQELRFPSPMVDGLGRYVVVIETREGRIPVWIVKG